MLRALPDDVETLRRSVAATALDRKAPKLEQARQGHRTTVLILEVWDVALANAGVVEAAVTKRVGSLPAPQPDVIVQVDTTVTPWMPRVVWEREAT